MNERRKALLGISGIAACSVWHKPIINSVVLPAHAETSPAPEDPADPTPPPPPPPPPAEDVCPMIIAGNVLFGPVSGTNVPPVCSATFEILSSDAATSLTIISITNGALPADTTVSIQDLGVATDGSGPRVVWQGPATDAPFCTDLEPVDDIVFTVTATCDAAENMGQFTQTFSLIAVLGS